MAQWLPARKSRIFVTGGSQRATDGMYKEAAGKFDATPVDGNENANGLLADHIGVDTVNTLLNFTVVVKSDAIVNYAVGSQVVAGFTDAGGKARSGTAYILNQSIPVAARGGYKISVETEFTDVVAGQ